MLYLNNRFKNYIKKAALKSPQIEVCGLIYKQKTYRIKLCENISKTPTNHFIISNQERYNIERKGTIVAFFHSHDDSTEPSEIDRLVSERLKINCIIYGVKSNEFTEYTPIGYEVPYLNRPFLLGLLDCLQLVRDYYQRELNVYIPDCKHAVRAIYEDWETLPENNEQNTTFRDHFLTNGFQEVNPTTLKKHDVILTKLPNIKCPVHVAVYLESNKILHHLPNRESVIEQYSPAMKKFTCHVMRHQTLF